MNYYHVPEKGTLPAQLVTFSLRDKGRQSQDTKGDILQRGRTRQEWGLNGEGLWAGRGVVSAYQASLCAHKNQHLSNSFTKAQRHSRDSAGASVQGQSCLTWLALPTFPIASPLSPSCAPLRQPRVPSGQRTCWAQSCHLACLPCCFLCQERRFPRSLHDHVLVLIFSSNVTSWSWFHLSCSPYEKEKCHRLLTTHYLLSQLYFSLMP